MLLTNNPFFLILLILFSFSFSWGAEEAPSAQAKPSKEGSLVLGTNRAAHGLTQTQNDFSLQGQLLLNLGPQLNLSFWAANASFSNENNHLQLRGQINVVYEMMPQVDFHLTLGTQQFFKSSFRNGSLASFGVNALGFIFNFSTESQFEGIGGGSNHTVLGYGWSPISGWLWTNTLGINQIKAQGYSNYFDGHSALEYPWAQKKISLGITFTSLKNEFNGRGKPNFYAQYTISF